MPSYANNKSTFSAVAFWQFSCELYEKPDVAFHCIKLQDNFNCNVNVILLGMWLLSYNQTNAVKLTLRKSDVQGLVNAIQESDKQLHVLRRTRRKAKGSSQYETYKKQELALEKQQQCLLIEALHTLPLNTTDKTSDPVMAICAYYQLSESIIRECITVTIKAINRASYIPSSMHNASSNTKNPSACSTIDTNVHGRIVTSDFVAPAWAKNRHVQTIFPRFFQKREPLAFTWEKMLLPDGDFVDIAWGPKSDEPKGVVVMFHGLEGSIRSHYANDMASYLSNQGWQITMMHFRGCGKQLNVTPRAYHSGDTQDARLFLKQIEAKFPHTPRVAVGVSLGGNMLLKLLGENPNEHGLSAAVAISAPLKLAECAESINCGFSRVYQKYLLENMKRKLRTKMETMDYSSLLTITRDAVQHIRDFREFDNNVTAPLHSFTNADDYYEKCSGYQYLKDIRCPTLILHAKDDPFMNKKIIPSEEELSPNVTMEISERGGHVGFVQGTPWKPKIWLYQRVACYFDTLLES